MDTRPLVVDITLGWSSSALPVGFRTPCVWGLRVHLALSASARGASSLLSSHGHQGHESPSKASAASQKRAVSSVILFEVFSRPPYGVFDPRMIQKCVVSRPRVCGSPVTASSLTGRTPWWSHPTLGVIAALGRRAGLPRGSPVVRRGERSLSGGRVRLGLSLTLQEGHGAK